MVLVRNERTSKNLKWVWETGYVQGMSVTNFHWSLSDTVYDQAVNFLYYNCTSFDCVLSR